MENLGKQKEFLSLGRKMGFWNSGKGFLFYCKHELFPGITFKDKTFLDIGAGKGIYCIYASLKGARDVTGLEPEAAGSAKNMLLNFKTMVKRLNIQNIKIKDDTLHNLRPGQNKFDVVLMHNSINHLNEEVCTNLHKSEVAKETYVNIFEKVRSLMNLDGKLIITDCARGNLSTIIGMKRGSRFNRIIEWHKHQNPKLWISLLEKCGFRLRKKSYKGISKYRIFTFLFKNKLMAFLRWNEFILTFDAI